MGPAAPGNPFQERRVQKKKQNLRVSAALLAGLFSLCLLTGCSGSSSSSTSSSEDSSSSESTASTNFSSSEGSLSQDIIGELTYIGSSSLVLDLYEPDTDITDYTDTTDITFTSTGESETVTLEDGVEYQTVSDGALTVIALDDLAEGDMVAVTTSEDGVQQIIVLEVARVEDDLASSSSVSENAELATEESALEEATGE